jgi:hypothetical protein
MTKRVRLRPRTTVLQPAGSRAEEPSSPFSVYLASSIMQQQHPMPAQAMIAHQVPARQTPPLEPLGTYLGGDLYEWVYGNQLCIPPEALWLHGVVLGEPGFGKTITLLRLATMAVRYGMQVIFLDLKGSKQTAVQFIAAMHDAGVGRIRVYPSEAYDGWRGDANALYNRLMALVDPGIHPYYARVDSALVSLAVRAPCGPPRSSRDFLIRFGPSWLRRAYAGKQHWYAQRIIRKVAPHIDATSLAYDGFFAAASGGLEGTFACEDGDAVYIGLDGSTLKEQAASIGRYLLEDFAHYATSLYELMREAGMSVWASAQSYQGLGAEREQVLAASSIKILHRCGDPEEMVRFAGMREQPAFSRLIDDEEGGLSHPAGSWDASKERTAISMQRVYAMPIEDVQQLARSTIALITGGLGAQCQIYPLALPPKLLGDAAALVAAWPVVHPTNVSPPPVPPPSAGKTRGRTESSSRVQGKQLPMASPLQGMHQREANPTQALIPLSPPAPGNTAKANEKQPTSEEDESPVDF